MLNLTPDIWKAGLRTAAAAGIALAVSHLLSLHQGYWAVISSIVIMQANLGASLEAAADRLLGTLAGAGLGFVVAYLTPSTTIGTLIGLMLATGLLSMLAIRYPSFRIAPVTAAILLISAPSHADASISAMHRVTEIGLGCVIGIAVSLLVAPSRAEARLKVEAGHALALLANLVTAELEGPEDKTGNEAIAAIGEDIHGSFAKIDKLTNETEEEHASRLARDAFDAERLRNCLRHLRTNIFFLRRVARQPWPSVLDDALVEPTAAVTRATRDYLVALGPAVVAGKPAPQLDELDQVFARFATEGSAVLHKIQHGSSPAGDDAIAFVSAFSFALEQVRLSIGHFAECVDDMSGTEET